MIQLIELIVNPMPSSFAEKFFPLVEIKRFFEINSFKSTFEKIDGFENLELKTKVIDEESVRQGIFLWQRFQILLQ